jgi:hypothetical protein
VSIPFFDVRNRLTATMPFLVVNYSTIWYFHTGF